MNKDFQRILDCFSAMDGGVDFIKLKMLVDEDHEIINNVLKEMVAIIDIATGKIK